MVRSDVTTLRSSAKRTRPSKKEQQDESIMDTNNSCIVSKRSVEKIYHKKDRGFLRYFVSKFARRSPLINRGYWLRMRAIEHVVRTFLQEKSCKKLVVVNLGCGYDPLPFKFLSQESILCKDTVFVDVDYVQLMRKKCDIIQATPELRSVLGNSTDSSQERGILLASPQYKAIACDLEDVEKLGRIFQGLLDHDDFAVLFIAEVSITYMDAAAAEKVIAWASGLKNSRFCLLEQYLPDGPSHPFAKTMLKHFDKLNSPLKSAIKHPSLQDQRHRFLNFGWPDVHAQSLWQLWADDKFLLPAERQELDRVEPFDEWEEFALFASHYFVLIANNRCSGMEISHVQCEHQQMTKDLSKQSIEISAICSENPKGKGRRRFGASFAAGTSKIYYHGGHGTQGRLGTCDVFRSNEVANGIKIGHPGNAQMWTTKTEFMCHTITAFAADEYLLVGGRRSPEAGSVRCLLGSQGEWCESQSLPYDLFRHCAVAINIPGSPTDTQAVLVFGGKSGSGEMRHEWLLWNKLSGWRELEVVGERPIARFGACVTVFGSGMHSGLLTGGIGLDGLIISDLWSWEVTHDRQVRCRDVTKEINISQSVEQVFGRFGATIVPSPMELPNGVLLIGGVAGSNFITQETEILHISPTLDVSIVNMTTTTPRPLLVGCSMESTSSSTFTILGGGAVCFSFGTCWNEGSYTIGKSTATKEFPVWQIEAEQKSVFDLDAKANEARSSRNVSLHESRGQRLQGKTNSQNDSPLYPAPVEGQILEKDAIDTPEAFEILVKNAKPVILRGFSVGKCLELWDADYLKQQLGEERKIVVHSTNSSTMNFLEKNFAYITLPFSEFMDRIEKGESMYLRALSSNRPAEKVTNLSEDFPTIAGDFKLPPQLEYAKTNMHSSPLRISGPVSMWLHYDVMSNVLCQIRGEKKLILFPPSDIKFLDFPPGASSSRLDMFDGDGRANTIASTHPIVFSLQPGDILFIPALWAHTAQPTNGTSVAVNVFFRNLEAGYAAGKDVYGNRDVQAYETGRRDVQKITNAFRNLPTEMGQFYLERLAAELTELAEGWGHKA